MAKAKAVQKTSRPPSKKAIAASLQSPNKKTSGRTTMNSSATAIQSMPIGRSQEIEKKGSAVKKKKTATKSKPEVASKRPALKVGVRGKSKAVVDKGKKPIKPKVSITKKTKKEPSKSVKTARTKPVESKKTSKLKQNQPQSVPAAPKKGRPPKKEEQKPEKAPSPIKKSENESPKKAKADIKIPVKSEVSKAAARTRSTESVNGQKSAASSRGPSRRESAASAVTPRSSRKSSVNSVGGKPAVVVKVKQQKESSPGPTSRFSRRNTSTSEKRESKSPSPRPSRKSSTTKEADDSKLSERSRRKSGSVSVPSLPSSRQSSPTRTSPMKKIKEGMKKVKEEPKKKTEESTNKKVKEEPREEPPKAKEAAHSKKGKEESKKAKEDSKTKKTKDEHSTEKKVVKSEPVEMPKRKLSAQKEPESKKTVGKEKSKQVGKKGKEPKPKKKTEKTTLGTNRLGSKRASTALATANSKAQSIALKSLSDDRSVARKLATKAIKASKAKAKPKPKPQLKLRPKLKKRMASLNAKAILEASFSETDKKQKSVSPPKSSPSKSSMNVFSPPTTAEATRQAIDGITSPSELAARYENLLSDLKIEIRSGPPPDNSYSQSDDEDKRKSKKRKTPRVDTVEEPKTSKPTSEMGTSTSTSTETASKSKKSKTSKATPVVEEVPTKKVRKEASVGTSETSTSTPTWGWEAAPYVPPPQFPPHPHPALTRYAVESTMIHQEPAGIRRTHQVYHSSHGPNGIESRIQARIMEILKELESEELNVRSFWGPAVEFDGEAQRKKLGFVFVDKLNTLKNSCSSNFKVSEVQKSNGPKEGVFHQVVDGTQYHHHTKENQTRPPPVALYDATVYQPAGPMIEQQKGPNLGLPQAVKLPPDLKVTYQTHPPSDSSLERKESATTTTRSQKSSRSSEAKSGSSRNKSKPAATTTTTSSSTPKAVAQTPPTVLHQPYKAAGVASSTRTVKVHQTTVVPAGNGAVTTTTNSSSFSVYGGGGAGAVMGSPGSGGSAVSQQHTLASTNLAMHHPALAVPSGGMYYPGLMGPPSQSPFSPNKYPMLPPESIRPPYLPVPPAAPSGFYLSPFYHSPLSVGGVPGLGSHPRALMPAPSAATAYYQQTLGSPSAAATTPHGSYLSPSASAGSSSHLQPSLHSIPSQSSPGHAGPFRPNPSSHPPACPTATTATDISRHRSIINNINTTNSRFNNIINTKPPLRQQLPQQQPRPRQSATLVAMRQGCENNKQTTNNQRRSNPSLLSNENTSTSRNYPVSALNTTGGRHAKGLLVPAIGAAAYSQEDTLKPSNHIDIQPTENGKTYSEQYSLPDDITITPILVVPEGAATSASTNKVQSVPTDLTKYGESKSTKTSMHGLNKPKDIVHVIDPRSGQTTTIAKHISNSSSFQSHLSPSKKIISPVKPNNAGNVGKINPDLDVIVIPAGQDRDQFLASYTSQSTRTMSNKRVFQTSALSSSNSTNVIGSAFKSQHWSGRPVLTGKSGSGAAVNFVQPLQVQIPGDYTSQQQRNKRKGTLDQVLDGLQKKRLKETGHMMFDRNRPNLTIQPKSPTSSARTMAKDQIFQMRNSTIVNEHDALVAVSALVVPANGAHVRLSPLKNGLRRGSTGSWSGKGKIATRSAIANAKIRTRSAIARRPLVGSSRVSPDHAKKLVRKRMAGKLADHWAHRRIPHGQRYNFVQRWKKAHAETSSVGSETSSTSSSNGAGSSVSSGQRSYSSSAIPVTTALAKMQESGGRIRGQVPGSLAFNALKKRAIVKPLSPNTLNGSLHTMMMARRQPKWSNGWRFEGEAFQAKVYLKNDDQPVIRRCYPAMRHDSGDVIQPRDCVLLKSGPRKIDLPFVAKVAALWENPTDGEMMFSLLWYYRPEHTDVGRTHEDMLDEIFASKHRDCNSVATIEDRCYVLTLNEYCRYKKRLKQLEENIPDQPPIVPLSDSPQSSISNFAANIALAVWQGKQLDGSERMKVPAAGKVSSEVVFFCRKVYDFKSKRLLKNPS